MPYLRISLRLWSGLTWAAARFNPPYLAALVLSASIWRRARRHSTLHGRKWTSLYGYGRRHNQRHRELRARCATRRRHPPATPFAGDRDFELERTQAWGYVAYAHRNDIAGCERAARHVDDLAAPFAGDRHFELQRTQAWGFVAYAHATTSRAASAPRDTSTISPHPSLVTGTSSFSARRPGASLPMRTATTSRAASAPRDTSTISPHPSLVTDLAYAGLDSVADAHRDDIAGCERAARHVDDLATPFAGDRDFELQRTEAWGFVAYAHRDDIAGCERAARHVDDLAIPFAGDGDFELQRTQAWRSVAYGTATTSWTASAPRNTSTISPHPSLVTGTSSFSARWPGASSPYARRDDIAGCERAARHVDDLAAPFAGDQDFELERTRAWRFVADAHRDDIAGCERAARHVDDLAAPFAGDRDFELQRTRAWLYVAYAHRNDIAGCERAARHVDDLATPFAGDQDFELQRTQAWGLVADAHRNDIAGSERAARHVDDLAGTLRW